MPDITPDPVAVYLAEIRADLRTGYSEKAVDRIREQHIPALLAMVEAVLELAAHHEHGALRWADSLPVPEWIPLVREAISRELPGEAPGA